MANPLTVRATKFSRSFSRCQREAVEAKLIVVTSRGRVVGGYLSADELRRYETLKAREREVLIVGELSDDAVTDIYAARYNADAQ